MSSLEALQQAGFDDQLIDRFLRPFLSGVFLESELATSRRFMDLVLRSMVKGTPSVPSAGMQALPDQLAAALPPGTVFTQTEVTSIGGLGPVTVTTTSGIMKACAVIVATDPTAVAGLIDGFTSPAMNGVTTWYHLADQDGEELAGGLPTLLIDGANRGPLVNSVVISNAAPSYAPAGRVLVSSSALGAYAGAVSDAQALAHASMLHGVPTTRWELIHKFAIPNALPKMSPPLDVRLPVALGDSRYVAGDHRDTASIQGALVSGRRAADAALTSLRPSGPR